MKRTLSAGLFLSALCAFWNCFAANVSFEFRDITNYPGMTIPVKLTPTNLPGVWNGSVILKDPKSYRTDTNGLLTITNLAPFSYTVEAGGGTNTYMITPFRITVPDTNATLNVTGLFSVAVSPSSVTSGYSQSVADDRFVNRSHGTAANLVADSILLSNRVDVAAGAPLTLSNSTSPTVLLSTNLPGLGYTTNFLQVTVSNAGNTALNGTYTLQSTNALTGVAVWTNASIYTVEHNNPDFLPDTYVLKSSSDEMYYYTPSNRLDSAWTLADVGAHPAPDVLYARTSFSTNYATVLDLTGSYLRTPLLATNVLYVDAILGNDLTGTRGLIPFRTVRAAVLASTNNDTIMVGPGTFNGEFFMPRLRSGVSLIGAGRQVTSITNVGFWVGTNNTIANLHLQFPRNRYIKNWPDETTTGLVVDNVDIDGFVDIFNIDSFLSLKANSCNFYGNEDMVVLLGSTNGLAEFNNCNARVTDTGEPAGHIFHQVESGTVVWRGGSLSAQLPHGISAISNLFLYGVQLTGTKFDGVAANNIGYPTNLVGFSSTGLVTAHFEGGLLRSFASAGFVNGAGITNLHGTNLQTGTLNSNKLDAATLALFGGGSGGIATSAGIGTNTTVYGLLLNTNTSGSTVTMTNGSLTVSNGSTAKKIVLTNDTATVDTVKATDGSGSNAAGTDSMRQGGASTGTGRGGSIIEQTTVSGASGSTANGYNTRVYRSAKAVAVVNNTATTICNVPLASTKFLGIRLFVSGFASDGTNHQQETHQNSIGAVNKAGTITTSVSANANAVNNVSSGTLTSVVTSVQNGNSIDIKVALNSSLTTTTEEVYWQLEINSNDTGTIVPQ